MKFYVECGTLRVVIDRETPILAAMDALDTFGSKNELGEEVVISQNGFDCRDGFHIYTKNDIIVDMSGEYD